MFINLSPSTLAPKDTYYALFPELSEAELKAKFPESFGTIELFISDDGTRYDGEIKDHTGKHLYTEMG